MARGYKGAFGGTKINSYPVWLGLCAIFLLGLVDWRRPLSVRNARSARAALVLGLAVVLQPRRHLRGDAARVPAAALAARCAASGSRAMTGRRAAPRCGRCGCSLAATGVPRRLPRRAERARVERDRRRLLGRDRRRPDRARRRARTGTFPSRTRDPKCGPADSARRGARPHPDERPLRDREPARRHLRAGRRTSPTSPATRSSAGATSGTRCRRCTSRRSCSTCSRCSGSALVGRRFGGPRLARRRRVRVGRVAVHAVRVELEHERLDRARAARLGLLRADERRRRAARPSRSPGWTKFASLLVLPLWSGYPEARRPRTAARTLLGFAVATAVVFFVLFLEPSPLHAARVFYDRTVELPDRPRLAVLDLGLGPVPRQGAARPPPRAARARRCCSSSGALALAWFPRRRSPLRMAALTAAVLIGFELVLTHWFYLYLPWFFPFVVLALVAPLPGATRAADDCRR